MRRAVVIVSIAFGVLGPHGATALAGQSDAPLAACNAGTMHAHTSVPGTTGAGDPIEAHEHIPEAEDGECIHEAFD